MTNYYCYLNEQNFKNIIRGHTFLHLLQINFPLGMRKYTEKVLTFASHRMTINNETCRKKKRGLQQLPKSDVRVIY